MNPNGPSSREAPRQLPPVVEQAPAGKSENTPKGTEAAPSGESGPQASAPMPTSIPLPIAPAMPLPSQPAATSSTSQANPAQASDDTDLIEKEWVTKAKQIVEQTRDNPFQQSEELTVFKADYMKKRYNRAIKLK